MSIKIDPERQWKCCLMTDNSRLEWGVHNVNKDKGKRKWYIGDKTGSSWRLINFGSVLNMFKLRSSWDVHRGILPNCEYKPQRGILR